MSLLSKDQEYRKSWTARATDHQLPKQRIFSPRIVYYILDFERDVLSAYPVKG